MAGSGDMLFACIGLSSAPMSLNGIEIDPTVAKVCRKRLIDSGQPFALVEGNAFDLHSWEQLPAAFDLVITNPPYVRYQIGSSSSMGMVKVPGTNEIRTALAACLARADNLGADEKNAFLRAATLYSGLADLAVPSWILSCARVAVGGRLAIVAPNTWLSRDYAVPVVYLLRRFFEIEYVVEDADAVWFQDALARTNLVVAKRVQDKRSPSGPSGHLNICLPSQISDERSLVGGAFRSSADPDEAFAGWAASMLSAKESGQFQNVRYSWSDGYDVLRALRHGSDPHQLFDYDSKTVGMTAVPEEIRRRLKVLPSRLASIEELGWTIGQGLRTGGNDFFYVSAHPTGVGYKSALLPGEQLDLPREALLPAVRRQAELPSDGGRVVRRPRSYVLILENWALPEDIQAARGSHTWRTMRGDLERLVRTAATTSYQRRGQNVSLPKLTAVRTNVRQGEQGRPARFWYQIPPLRLRHTPDIYLARVNGGFVTPYFNTERSLAVDANFSTLWTTKEDAVDAAAMLGLLSSSWTRAFLEATGTVLGGGALKVEATHLRRLVLPAPDASTTRTLSKLTTAWRNGNEEPGVIELIDRTVISELGSAAVGNPLFDIALQRLQRRIG